MPPIMGSAAFVLASFTRIPYHEVALYSFLPALLYYWALYIQVDFLSHRLAIPVAKDAPPVLDVLKKGGHMLIPIVLVFVLIFVGMTPYRAALWTIGATILLHYIRPLEGKRLSLKDMLMTFGDGAKLQLTVGASAGVIGVIIAMLVLPGLPLKIASFAVGVSHGNLMVLLFLMIITSYIFGMGIPMVAAYIVLAVIAVPALEEIGLPLFNAHLIIMWFSLAALWTPPVAVGAFVASGIAGASPNRIGWYAAKLGIGLYIIPFLMAYGTIINGTVPEISVRRRLHSRGAIWICGGDRRLHASIPAGVGTAALCRGVGPCDVPGAGDLRSRLGAFRSRLGLRPPKTVGSEAASSRQ